MQTVWKPPSSSVFAVSRQIIQSYYKYSAFISVTDTNNGVPTDASYDDGFDNTNKVSVAVKFPGNGHKIIDLRVAKLQKME